jgi:hypothetical protein
MQHFIGRRRAMSSLSIILGADNASIFSPLVRTFLSDSYCCFLSIQEKPQLFPNRSPYICNIPSHLQVDGDESRSLLYLQWEAVVWMSKNALNEASSPKTN